DIPAVRLGRSANRNAPAGERDRDSDLRRRRDLDARERRPAARPRVERIRVTAVSSGLSPAELQKAARDHLWLHFTRMSGYRDQDVPVIVRGDGCYLEDSN